MFGYVKAFNGIERLQMVYSIQFLTRMIEADTQLCVRYYLSCLDDRRKTMLPKVHQIYCDVIRLVSQQAIYNSVNNMLTTEYGILVNSCMNVSTGTSPGTSERLLKI